MYIYCYDLKGAFFITADKLRQIVAAEELGIQFRYPGFMFTWGRGARAN